MLFEHHGSSDEQVAYSRIMNLIWKNLGPNENYLEYLHSRLTQWCKEKVQINYARDCNSFIKNLFASYTLGDQLDKETKSEMIAQLREYSSNLGRRRRKYLALVRKLEIGEHMPEARFLTLAKQAYKSCIGDVFSGKRHCTEMQFYLLAGQYYNQDYIAAAQEKVNKVIHLARAKPYQRELDTLWTAFKRGERLSDQQFKKLQAFLLDP